MRESQVIQQRGALMEALLNRALKILALVLGIAFATPASAQEVTDYSYDALGRLIKVAKSGSSSGSHAICYDAAGNRTEFDARSGSTAYCTPAASNLPPVTVADSIQVACNASGSINVVANDTDPEGNTPLSLTAVVVTSGDAQASVLNSTTASVTGAWDSGTTQATYTVQDSLGASSTGSLTIQSVGGSSICGV